MINNSFKSTLFILFIVFLASYSFQACSNQSQNFNSTFNNLSSDTETIKFTSLPEVIKEPSAVYERHIKHQCNSVENSTITVVSHDGGDYTTNQLGSTPFFFAAKVELDNTFTTKETEKYYYALYAYINGQWMIVSPSATKMVLAGKQIPAQYIFDFSTSVVTYKAFSDDSTPSLAYIDYIPKTATTSNLGLKHYLGPKDALHHASQKNLLSYPFIKHLPLNDNQKLEILEALRRRSWYGKKFGLTYLNDIEYLIDLSFFGNCLAKYSNQLSTPQHLVSPLFVLSKPKQ